MLDDSIINTNAQPSDDAIRKLALDPRKSFIVQAPAGSGKTELLIQRVLTLLQYVKSPEEILAITFTKKAANEMRQRVIKALKAASQINSSAATQVDATEQTRHIAMKVLERDKQFEWNLILNPNRLHIQTIDSLCTYLTKSLPLLSRFGSQPNINDSPHLLYREAVQTVLTHLEDEQLAWSDDIANLLTHLDNDLNKLSDLLVELLAKRDQWMQYIHLDIAEDAIKQTLEEQLALVIDERLSALRDCFPSEFIEELLALIRFGSSNESTLLASCKDLVSLPDGKINDKTQWTNIAQFLLTKDFTWRKKVDKKIGFPALASIKNSLEQTLHKNYRARFIALINSLQANEALRSLLKEVLLLPEAHYSDNQWKILKSLFQVLKVVCAQLRLVFQKYGQIDFIENAQAALAALGDEDNPTDLLLSLDYSISHILIDEFQDTSSSQYQLLSKLILGWENNDGRSLFVVGDPMQSIYRFREAEVGLFIRMRSHGIGNLNLIPLTLTANFRSAKQIVDWNNLQFSKIFPCNDDIATGAVAYSKSIAKNSADGGGINIYRFITTSDEEQANTIAEIILQQQRLVPNNTIAILVRSRSHLRTIIPALKGAEIPFHAIDIDPLANRQCIQDLVSLTCALLHLADRISWLAILRAPWCGLCLNDLLIVTDNNPHSTIWEQLLKPDIITRLSVDGQNRIKKFSQILQSQLNDKERYDLRTWLETTWFLIGGPATLSNKTEIEDAQAYFDLLSGLAQTNPIVSIDLLKEKINSFYASNSAHSENCYLQLMTIHSAKGLEFDTVILPHLERQLPKDDKSLLNWLERPLSNDAVPREWMGSSINSALLIAPLHAVDDDKDALYEYIYRQKNIKSEYETDRLFYVATTRAKSNLHLLFNIENADEKNEATTPTPGSFLAKIWHNLPEQQWVPNSTTAERNTDNLNNRCLKRLSSTWHNIINSAEKKLFFHRQQSGFMLQNNIAKGIGTVIHLVLANIANAGMSFWFEQKPSQQYLLLKQLLLQTGVTKLNIEFAIKSSHHAIENCLHDARGQWILTPHKEARSEYAISALIDNQKPSSDANARDPVIHRLIIDRTFIDEKGIRWIIDYKSTQSTEGELEEFLEHEYEQYKDKMQLYCNALRELDHDRPIRLGLYFPAIPAWKEWDPLH